ncbi:MAG: CHAT domain-containing protein, partial [Thermoanaerobaculia bacterium]|nr:CHAT domain-containing protein [Thermoanaerobaculia bacterium]
IGAALAPTDRFLADVVAGIDGVKGDVMKTGELAAAVRGFYGGLRAYQEYAYLEAHTRLSTAAGDLATLDHPLAWRARYLAVLTADSLGLGERLNQVDDFLAGLPRSHRVLVGQGFYLRGLVQARGGFPERSLADLEAAVTELGELGEVDPGTAYRSVLASNRKRAHDLARAEEEDRRWIAAARRLVAPYYRLFVASSVDEASKGAAADHVSLAAARESLAIEERSPSPKPSWIAEIRTSEFEALSRLGRNREADLTREAVLAAIAGLSDTADRARSRGDLLRRESLLPYVAGRPSRFDLIEQAINFYAAAGINEQLVLQEVGLRSELAAHANRLGRFPQAVEAAEKAFEQLAERAAATADRIGFAGKVVPVTKARVWAGLAQADSPPETYLWAERGHHLSAPVAWTEVVPAAELATRLPAGTTLVEFVVFEGSVVVVTVSAAAIATWLLPKPAVEPWATAARGFARTAVEPWLCGRPRGERLVIVPGGLAAVTFAALPIRCPGEGEELLVERHVTSLAPSATFWLDARARADELAARGPARSLLAVGVETAKGFEQTPLARARGEAETLAGLYTDPATRLLLDESATKETILERFGRFDLVHFATHGVIDLKTPGGSYLALTAGRLAAGDLPVRSANPGVTRLVVLSACDTGGTTSGAEGLVGVSRAFLEAGVPAVVATLGRVADVYAPRFMRSFHEEYQKTGDATAALAAAQRTAAREQWPTTETPGADPGVERTTETGPPEWAKWVVVGG